MRRSVFTINLDKIKRDGKFTCPLCEVTISHDDESGSVYEIVALTMPDNESLRGMSTVCRGCRSIIPLQGFENLSEKYHSPQAKKRINYDNTYIVMN